MCSFFFNINYVKMVTSIFKKIMFFFIMLFFTNVVFSQNYTQTYVDKCSGEIKTVKTTYVSGYVVISFYDQVKTFTPLEVQSGVVQSWLDSVYFKYSSLLCPTSQVVQQTVTQTVSQTASSTASSASSSTASSATSSTTSTTSSSGDSSSNSSSDDGGSNDSQSDQSDGDGDEKKKEKTQNPNPILLSSDLTTMENFDGGFNVVFSTGLSKSTLMGDRTFGVNAMIWGTLNQFVITGSTTKMKLENGKLKSIHNYSTTYGYLKGNHMNLLSYTMVVPNKNIGTYGFNFSLINLLSNNLSGGLSHSMPTSFIGFWTKPYQYNSKLTLSPEIFIIINPLSYKIERKESYVLLYERGFNDLSGLVGCSFDYRVSKRFGFSFNYKLNINTSPNFNVLNNFLIGSRMIL